MAMSTNLQRKHSLGLLRSHGLCHEPKDIRAEGYLRTRYHWVNLVLGAKLNCRAGDRGLKWLIDEAATFAHLQMNMRDLEEK